VGKEDNALSYGNRLLTHNAEIGRSRWQQCSAHRSSAGSSACGLLVAAMTMTPPTACTPSISVSSVARMPVEISAGQGAVGQDGKGLTCWSEY
jgi:hypothetical protein